MTIEEIIINLEKQAVEYENNAKEMKIKDSDSWSYIRGKAAGLRVSINLIKKLGLSDVSCSVFDDKIDEWHNSDTPLSLYEYLGLTEEQFKIWLQTPEEIEKHYR